MNDRDRKMWMQQFTMLSRQLESMDSSEAARAMVTTAAAITSKVAEDVSQMSKTEKELMMPSFYQLASACEAYSETTGADQSDISYLENARKKLRDAESAGRRLAHELDTVNRDIAGQRSKNDELERAIASRKADLAAEKSRAEKKAELIRGYPGELAKIEQEIVRLDSELVKAEKTADSLRIKRDDVRLKLEDSKKSSERIQHEIETYSESEKRAAGEFVRLSAELAALGNAKSDCSPEKQKELSRKIAELRPDVEKLKAQMEVLNQEYTALSDMKTGYDRERLLLTSNVFELIHDHMDALGDALEDQKTNLLAAEKKAQMLHENMKKTADRRDELKAWFDTERTPLEAMCAKVSGADSEMLRKELDPGKIASVRDLFRDIEGKIGELDDILTRCFRAAAEDQESLRRKTPV